MDIVRIHPADNVAVAVAPVEAGARLDAAGIPPQTGGTPSHDGRVCVTALADIPSGHKIALLSIPAGGAVVKYGYPIGRATRDIRAGEHVHTHNLATALTEHADYVYAPSPPPASASLRSPSPACFMGYRRAGGAAGIRNEIWIIPTVGCVNAIAETIAERARARLNRDVYAFPHPYGCSQLGDDHINTMKILCGLATHPNTAGALVLGLGCENNGVAGMREMLGEHGEHGDYDARRVRFLVCQESGDEIAEGLALLAKIADASAADIREPVPVSELVVGLKCGGSDGLSGITANPLVGAFSDRLVADGGAAILTEVPEMFGAETILMNRCADREVFDRTVELINGFKAYFARYGQPVYENPSPGNREGGITTLEEKSLGCTQKAGTAAVNGVLGYGDAVRARGLNLLRAPGNDLVAATALAASGAHLILFTTGRGTPLGAPVPTVKISSNTPLYERKRTWIDFDAGPLAAGASQDAAAESLYAYVLGVAGGAERTRTERNGVRGIAIFKDGVTL